jgi:hypothetical protein
MSAQNVKHVVLHLNEKESVQLARAVQVLVRELGFDPEAVDRSYEESLAYFMKNDHFDQSFRADSLLAGRTSTTA